MIDFSNADALNLDASIDVTIDEVKDIFNNSLLGGACHIGNCSVNFGCFEESELHHCLLHRNACESCGRAFPNERLLECHIEVVHSASLCKQYSCILPVCEEKFKDPASVKEHAIKEHKIPSNFRYFPLTSSGIAQGGHHYQPDARKRPAAVFHGFHRRQSPQKSSVAERPSVAVPSAVEEPMEMDAMDGSS